LDRVDRDDFALGGLARRLAKTSAQILLQQADPEAEATEINDDLWTWLENHAKVDVGGHVVRFGDRRQATAHAAAIVAGHGAREPWNHYVALHRSGNIELGLGDLGGWERRPRDGEPVRVFNLVSIVTYAWALLKVATALNEYLSLVGPRQLTLGLRRTQDAWLGNVGQGWAEPGSFENDIGGPSDEHLLWHLELNDWPDDESQKRVACNLGDRLEDAWGVTQRRYLARSGGLEGHLDVSKVLAR
jgi:hypothetical protein